MKTTKRYIVWVMLLFGLTANAQIGYQVSLLNSATGEPRANETVSVQVEITNSANTVICSETQSTTTNEFGVLSLQIGNASTFANVDWSKLPLYVSATVDGIMIGKSQILNVPVAEAAKKIVNVSPDLICKTWTAQLPETGMDPPITYQIRLTNNNTFSYESNIGGYDNASGVYIVQGNIIFLCKTSGLGVTMPTCLIYNNGKLYCGTLGFGALEFN